MYCKINKSPTLALGAHSYSNLGKMNALSIRWSVVASKLEHGRPQSNLLDTQACSNLATWCYSWGKTPWLATTTTPHSSLHISGAENPVCIKTMCCTNFLCAPSSETRKCQSPTTMSHFATFLSSFCDTCLTIWHFFLLAKTRSQKSKTLLQICSM
jgi:hypothetical protein